MGQRRHERSYSIGRSCQKTAVTAAEWLIELNSLTFFCLVCRLGRWLVDDICARLCWLLRLASNYRRACAAGPRRTLGQHGLALWEIARWVQVAVGRQGTGSTLARHRGTIPTLQSIMADAVRDGVGRPGPRPASETDARRVHSWAVAEAFLTSSPEGKGLSRTPRPARPPASATPSS